MATGTMTHAPAGTPIMARSGLSEAATLADLLSAASKDLASPAVSVQQSAPMPSVMSNPGITLIGGGGGDFLLGGSGDDWLEGGGGYDTLIGSGGDDWLDGGESYDELYGGEGDDTLNGGNGDDWIYGGPGSNVIIASTGIDLLYGEGGSSTVDYTDFDYAMEISLVRYLLRGEFIDFGDWYLPSMYGGTHVYQSISGIKGTRFADKFSLETKSVAYHGNVYDGGAGNDTFSFRLYTESVHINFLTNENSLGISLLSFESIIGSAMNDTITGSDGNETLNGGSGNDRLDGSGGDDYLYGGAGNDTLLAGTGWNELFGGDGDDLFLLGSHYGNNQYRGGDGFDIADYSDFSGSITIAPWSGNYQIGKTQNDGSGSLTYYDYLIDAELLRGTNSNDYFYLGTDGGPAGMSFDGSGGTDTLSFLYSGVGVSINLGNKVLESGTAYFSIENFEGSNHSDTINGSKKSDVINALAGDDTVFGDLGRDTLVGGNGSDTLSYASGGSVRIDLQNGGAQKGGMAHGDVISGFETIIGSATGPNWFRGDSGDNVFEGGTAADTFVGSAGSDEVFGGAGTDTVDYRDYGKQNTKRVVVNDDMSVVKTGPSQAVTSGQPTDTLHSIERFLLTQHGDIFYGLEDQSTFVSGEGGNDDLYAVGIADTLIGGAGDDIIHWGTSGSPTLSGSGGWDTLSLHLRTSGVTVTPKTAQAGGDTARISGFESYIGSIYNDTITGGAGAETIDGSFGNDVLRGGLGRDTFLLNVGDDRILDFRKGHDTIATTMSASVVFTITNSGADKVISWGDDSVTLVGLARTSFTADDILHI